MAEQDTRDMAVAANTKIDQHMTDCTKFREALTDTLKEFRDDLKKLNWRMAMIIGGIVLFSHGIDWIMASLGHGR